MKQAIDIFRSALRHLARNWLATVKVFFAPSVLILLAFMVFGLAAYQTIYSAPVVFYVLFAAFVILALVLCGWSAVRFHRYILLNENPAWFGELRFVLSAKYAIYLTLLSCIMVAIVLLPALAIVELSRWFPPILLLIIVLVFTAFYIFARLSPLLVETAIGRSRGIREIWAISGKHKSAFWGLAVYAYIIQMISKALERIDPSLIASIIFDILSAIIGVAMLTETYLRFFIDDKDEPEIANPETATEEQTEPML